MKDQLIMGNDQAEGIRKLHHEIAVWLAWEYNCPHCIDEYMDPETPEEYLVPYPGCPLCEGRGIVTGQQIEEYAIYNDRSLLPAWWPRGGLGMNVKWTRTENQRVWEADDGFHYAVARDSEYHRSGYSARVYERQSQLQMPLFDDPLPDRDLVGTSMWSEDLESALRMSIRRFDPEAELPPLDKLPG